MRAGFLFGSSPDESSVPRAVPASQWAFWVRLNQDDCVNKHVQSKDLAHTYWHASFFEGHGWFIARRQSAQNWPAAWWVVQDGAFRLPQMLGVIRLAEYALLELWASWTESEGRVRVDSCEVHFCSPRISIGCSTEAVVTALPNLRPGHSWMKVQAWVQIFLNEFSGLLSSKLLKTKIFLMWVFQLNSPTTHHFEG